ncbi:MAG TPA: GNAT family N-acetyltransferase [Casimicrobiaceae bacterium]|jgi:putative acetyltransferase|nr:GNAT family N-acetyltransferase [Casimicrobiaceae bacterium]
MAGERAIVVVRRAETGDAPAIAKTFAASSAYAGTLQLPFPSASLWEKRLAANGSDDHVLVALVDGEIVGNGGLHPASKSPRRRHAGTIGVAVRDDWHGRGVGTALMTAIVDLADNWIGYSRLELTAYTDNEAALALYRKFGFEIEGTARRYAWRGGVLVDAYMMARHAGRG